MTSAGSHPRTAHGPPLDLLLVDDDPTDVFFASLLLEEQPHPYTLTPVTSCDAALAYLERADSLPDLILLDLQMDGMQGFELLERLKAHPQWRAIPVIVLTASTHPDAVLRAYHLGASGYLVKDSQLSVMRDHLLALLHFWRFVRLPFRHSDASGSTARP